MGGGAGKVLSANTRDVDATRGEPFRAEIEVGTQKSLIWAPLSSGGREKYAWYSVHESFAKKYANRLLV